VLRTNGMTPASSIWAAFDGGAVIRDVGNRLARQHVSILSRVRGSVWSGACRIIFRSCWAELQKELRVAKKA
jgi:hypothetical protein